MKRNRLKPMPDEPKPAEAPADPKPAPPAKLTVASACAAARVGLKVALAAFIAAGIRENDPQRLQAETTFEDVKNGEPTRKLLAAAVDRLQAVADLLANTSTARPDDVRAVRTAASVAAKNLQALTPA